MNNKLLTYVLVGGVFYWGWKYFLMQDRKAEVMVAQANGHVRPTDSMMPGSLIPAAQGVIKDGQQLRIQGT